MKFDRKREPIGITMAHGENLTSGGEANNENKESI